MQATLLALVVLAEAPLLTQARGHMTQLDYRRADDVLASVERQPSLERADVLALYELQGVVAASLGDELRAVTAFTRLLALHPEHRLTGSVPPKVSRPFQQAQAAVARDGPLTARLDVLEHTGAIEAIDVTVTGATTADVARVLASCATPTGARTEFDVAPVGGRVRLPCQGTLLYVHARAVSAVGWTLAEVGRSDAPLSVVPGGVVPPAAPAPASATAPPAAAPSATASAASRGVTLLPDPAPRALREAVWALDAPGARARLVAIDAELQALPEGWGGGNVALAVIGSLLVPALVVGVPWILFSLADLKLLAVGIGLALGGVAGIVMAAVGVGNGTRQERTTRERRFTLNRERALVDQHLRALEGPAGAGPSAALLRFAWP